jgi:hypothetical protein
MKTFWPAASTAMPRGADRRALVAAPPSPHDGLVEQAVPVPAIVVITPLVLILRTR